MTIHCYKQTPCKNCKYYQLNEEKKYTCFRQHNLSKLVGRKIYLETIDGRKSCGIVLKVDEYGLLHGDWGRYTISEEQIVLIFKD